MSGRFHCPRYLSIDNLCFAPSMSVVGVLVAT